MNIKSLLLGSAAALVAVFGARAADAVVVAEPEPVEYVRVCDTYGAGFFYIPGTETCLKISGYMRFDAQLGDDVYSGKKRDTAAQRSRATVRFDARSETELGTLRSFIETRFQFDDGADKGTGVIPHAYIELGGFRIGLSDSLFGSFTNYAGDVINDDIIDYDGEKTNQVSYTFAGGNGFSALIGLEQGGGDYENGLGSAKSSYVIKDYMPHVVAGAKYEQSWGSISAVGGYDSTIKEFAGKVRLDAKLTDAVSAFVMAGYQSGWGDTKRTAAGLRAEKNYFGAWNGDYAVWGGLTAKVSEKATLNGQVSYEKDGTIGAVVNVAYELVPGFTITPEVAYTKFDGKRKEAIIRDGGNKDAFGGIIRFQRNF